MKIFGLQFDIAWEDPPKNYQKVSDHFQKHRPAPGTLCVLPEMFSTGFSMNTAATRESSSAATEQFLGSLAAQYQVGIIAGQVSGPPGAKPMNEAIFIGPTGKLEARYAKQRPFGPAGESDHYTPGHQPVVVNWQGFRLGLFVCYDLRFPSSSVKHFAKVQRE